MNFEKEVLIRRFPRLARRHYTDVQALAKAVSDRQTPRIHDNLIALGSRVTGRLFSGVLHCAGNDVVRNAVVLLCLLSRTSAAPVLNFELCDANGA
jgi:hypothetical protein